MALRSSVLFSAAFVFLAFIYGVSFNVAVRTDATSAQSRFVALKQSGRVGAASTYGVRALELWKVEGESDESLAAFKLSVAETSARARRFEEALTLYDEVLASQWATSIPELDRAVIEDRLARSLIVSGKTVSYTHLTLPTKA